MIWGVIFLILLVAALGFSSWFGGREERWGIAIVIGNAVATLAVLAFADSRWAHLESAVLIVDLATLLAFAAVSLRSDKFWPLWVTGMQLAQLATHMARVAKPELLPKAYSAGQSAWAWLQILVILIAAWRMMEAARSTRSPS